MIFWDESRKEGPSTNERQWQNPKTETCHHHRRRRRHCWTNDETFEENEGPQPLLWYWKFLVRTRCHLGKCLNPLKSENLMFSSWAGMSVGNDWTKSSLELDLCALYRDGKSFEHMETQNLWNCCGWKMDLWGECKKLKQCSSFRMKL